MSLVFLRPLGLRLIGEAEQVAELLQKEMMAAADLKVPLSVEVKTGDNWYETK